MRNVLISFFFFGIASFVTGQGIEFFHGTWEEALMKAKAEDRIIFVDAYTTWCGPCKNMSANTFPNEDVGKFFNQHFLSMKIDMEKEMGLEFRKKFPVSAYPTLFFIDADQEVVQKVVGAKGPADLIKLGESIIAKYDKSTKYVDAYEAGDRSYELVYAYIAALNKAGKPTVKMANEFLAEQKDLTTPENLRFILEAASHVDCQCFDLLEKYKKEITAVTSADAVAEKIRLACASTVKRAIEYESPELITLAGDAMKKHLAGEAEFFRSQSTLQYALALHDMTNIEEHVNAHVKKHIKNDAPGLHKLALDLEKYAGDHPGCMNLAVELAGKAAKTEEVAYVAAYASLVHKTRGKEEAIRILDEALGKYKTEEEESKDFQQLKALRNKISNG